jgi:hypothetical protein
MEGIRYTKQLPDYRPIESRKPEQLLKRLPEGNNGEGETGHLLT